MSGAAKIVLATAQSKSRANLVNDRWLLTDNWQPNLHVISVVRIVTGELRPALQKENCRFINDSDLARLFLLSNRDVPMVSHGRKWRIDAPHACFADFET